MDFVLGAGEVAVEVKGATRVDSRDLRPLLAFVRKHKPRAAVVVCNERQERVAGGIRIMPWRSFLGCLWSGGIIA